MDGEEIWEATVALVVGGILVVALLGYDPSLLSEIVKTILIVGFVIAFSVAIIRSALN